MPGSIAIRWVLLSGIPFILMLAAGCGGGGSSPEADQVSDTTSAPPPKTHNLTVNTNCETASIPFPVRVNDSVQFINGSGQPYVLVIFLEHPFGAPPSPPPPPDEPLGFFVKAGRNVTFKVRPGAGGTTGKDYTLRLECWNDIASAMTEAKGLSDTTRVSVFGIHPVMRVGP
jgi:hypothetical protein